MRVIRAHRLTLARRSHARASRSTYRYRFTFAVADPPKLLRTVTVAGAVPEKLNEPSYAPPPLFKSTNDGLVAEPRNTLRIAVALVLRALTVNVPPRPPGLKSAL